MKIDFGTAEKIARELQEIDSNELGKVFSYLRATKSIPKTKEMLERFLKSKNYSRSNRTKGYYEAINKMLKSHNFSNADEALQTIGWARRLMKYYGDGR